MDMLLRINEDIFNYFFLIGGFLISYIIYKIFFSILCDNNYVKTKYRAKGHTWRSIQCIKSIPFNNYCTICGKLMLPLVGLFCECCATSACKGCHRIIDKKFKCKQISWPKDKPFRHLWVNVGTVRGIHSEGDYTEDTFKKYFCSWCQRSKISRDNVLTEAEPCDFQKYKNIIIPPTSVAVEKGAIRIKPEIDKNWEPLILFANRKSGSNRGDELLSLFRGILNPIQVIDLSSISPENVVKWLPPRCRVVVGGGDGTVAWVLNALMAAPHVRAPVAIIPLGTGNDLSRTLGWGAGTTELDAEDIVTQVYRAQEQMLDRWKVSIRPRRSRLSRARPDRVLFSYNYTSVGVDAQVALDFHRARSQFLYRYASRTLNYIAYVFLGAGRALDDGGCYGLEKRVRLKLDDNLEPLPLPPLQALVLLNIPSWGAGVDLWSMGSEDVEEQNVDDGKLEVAGVSSSFHIARLQCGLAEPFRFAQASKVKIELSGRIAMQVDGEPWMQPPASIAVEPAGQSLLLRRVEPHSSP